MNVFREDYTQVEWLQMGVFLIGLPVAAVVGALVGLVGRWKQGRVMTTALVGLGGAAITSTALFLVFLVIGFLETKISSTVWLQFFDGYMSWRYTTIAVIATISIAFLGAIGFRARDSKQTAYSISMRQILLLQVYAFIALGCWSGMRFFALSRFSGYQRTKYQWGKQEWQVLGDDARGPIGLERVFLGARTPDWKRENESLRRAAAEPWLRAIHLHQMSKVEAMDFGILSTAKHLQIVSLQYESNTLVPQSHLDTLGSLSTLHELYFLGGDFRKLDLSPLLKSGAIKRLDARDSTFDEDQLKRVIRKLDLAQFAIFRSRMNWYFPAMVTFSEGKYHLIVDSPVNPSDLDWINPKQVRSLVIRGAELTAPGAKHIAEMTQLDELELECQIEGPPLEEIAANSTARRIVFSWTGRTRDEEAFERAFSKLLLMPSLVVLEGYIRLPRELSESEIDQTSSASGRIVLRAGSKINEDRKKLGLKELTVNPDEATRRRILATSP